MENTYEYVLDNDTAENKQKYWEVAFGLQAVDDLKPSRYVRELAKEHIAGEKTYREVLAATKAYYETGVGDSRSKEVDFA